MRLPEELHFAKSREGITCSIHTHFLLLLIRYATFAITKKLTKISRQPGHGAFHLQHHNIFKRQMTKDRNS